MIDEELIDKMSKQLKLYRRMVRQIDTVRLIYFEAAESLYKDEIFVLHNHLIEDINDILEASLEYNRSRIKDDGKLMQCKGYE